MTAAAAPAIDGLVHQTSTTTGTGNLTLAAVNGKRSFDTAFGHAATTDFFYYFISNESAAEYEWGTGHMSDATTLVRDTVIVSTNSNNAVSLSAGTKDVICDTPAANQWVASLATITSSGTTDLGSVPSSCITVSGTTTITSFGSTAKTGVVKFCEFSGALTLTHNATSLIIPGGANVTTAAGDCLVARHEGSGNWRVVVYQQADGTSLVHGPFAAQSDMEAATSTTLAVTPGRQHFNEGHPKVIYRGIIDLSAANITGNISAVDTGTEIITWSTTHGLSSGQIIQPNGGTWPTGVTLNALYYVNIPSTTTLTLHTTYADSIAGTNKVNLTAAGSGTRTAHVVTTTDYFTLNTNTSAPGAITYSCGVTATSPTMTFSVTASSTNATRYASGTGGSGGFGVATLTSTTTLTIGSHDVSSAAGTVAMGAIIWCDL